MFLKQILSHIFVSQNVSLLFLLLLTDVKVSPLALVPSQSENNLIEEFSLILCGHSTLVNKVAILSFKCKQS